jgi:hypothetical protein
MARIAAALLLAAAFAAPAPALASSDSLVVQASTDSVAAGGTVDLKVLGLLHPNGKASVPVRAADLEVTATGGGSVAPASADPGELRWVYRAPETAAADLAVVVEARVKAYPDARGAVSLKVKASPAAKPAPDAAPKGDGKEKDKDDDGDEVAGEKAVEADPIGSLCTLERWRVREGAEDKWADKKIPERGATMYVHVPIQSYKFRINRKDVNFVEVHWWRNDRPKAVRAYTQHNRQLDVSKDQDGMTLINFKKEMGKPREGYTFSIVVTLADGKTLRENMTVFWGSEKAEERKKKD